MHRLETQPSTNLVAMNSAYASGENIAFLIVSVLIIASNAAEINLLLRKRSHFLPFEQLLLSLSASDMLVGISTSLISLLDLFTSGTIDKNTLKKQGMIPIWCTMLVSVFHVYWLTFDRSLAVTHPIRHRIWITKRKTTILIVVTWLICCASVPLAIFVDDVGKQILIHAVFSTSFSVAFDYLVIIYEAVYKRRKRITNNLPTQLPHSRAREYRLVFICLLISTLFIALSLPFALQLKNKKNSSFPAELALICNSLVNPYIYFFWNYCMENRSRHNVEP